MGKRHAEVPIHGVAAFIGFAARLESTLPFGFNPGDALTGTQGKGVWSADVCVD